MFHGVPVGLERPFKNVGDEEIMDRAWFEFTFARVAIRLFGNPGFASFGKFKLVSFFSKTD